MEKGIKAQNNTQNICDVTVSSRENKNGITTYLLRKARPRAVGQPRQSEFSMTWKNIHNLTGKKLEKALNEQVHIFLNEYKKDISGVKTHPKNILFSDYAQSVICTKETAGVKKSTLSRYEKLLVRINERFGNIPIKDINTTMLNNFYRELATTIKDSTTKALCKVNVLDIIKPYYITKVEISKLSGLSLQTINACLGTKGKKCKRIEYYNAESITNAINALLFDKEKLSETNRIRKNNNLPYLHAPKKPYMINDLFEIIESTETLSPKTTREYHRLLSIVFEQATVEELLDKNPAAKAQPPKLKHKEAQFYEPDEIQKMRECMELDIQTAISTNRKPNFRARAILYLMMSTGCRRGEIAGLTWDSIDFENNLIYIYNNLLHNSKYGTYIDTVKTVNSKRTLYLDSTTKKALLDYKSQIEDIKRNNANKWNESNFVFVRDNGEVINPDSITRWCSMFAKRYNLPHIHPHGFRHTLASIMLSNKASIIDVSRYLGHSKPSVTSDIYAHVLRNANIELGQDISKLIMGATENA